MARRAIWRKLPATPRLGLAAVARGTARALSLLGSMLLAPLESEAVAISPGDIIVAAGQGAGAAIVKVHPLTGAQSTISAGGSLGQPRRIVQLPDGDLMVFDASLGQPNAADGCTPTRGGFIRVDPVSGMQTVLGSANTCRMEDIALTETGDILLTDSCPIGGCPNAGVIWLFNDQGTATNVWTNLRTCPSASCPLVSNPGRMAAGLGDAMYIWDPATFLLEFFPSTGAISGAAGGPSSATDIAFQGPGAFVSVHSGQVRAASGMILASLPVGGDTIEIETDGDLLVLDPSSLWRIDPHSGDFVMISSFSINAQDMVIASVAVVPEPATAILVGAGLLVIGITRQRRPNSHYSPTA